MLAVLRLVAKTAFNLHMWSQLPTATQVQPWWLPQPVSTRSSKRATSAQLTLAKYWLRAAPPRLAQLNLA